MSTTSYQYLNQIATDYERDGVAIERQLFTPSQVAEPKNVWLSGTCKCVT
jgi:hypothetical protein